jgi:hypothetical protein
MSDLIDRQAAIDVIDAVFPVDPMKSEYAQGIACGAALAKTYVEQLPSADVRPVIKGKWVSEIRHHKTNDEEFDYWYTYCSVCGCHKRISWFDAKFCPNCGADMRGDTDE